MVDSFFDPYGKFGKTFILQNLPITVVTIGFLLALLWLIYSVSRDVLNYFLKEHINRYLLIRKIKPHYKQVLVTQFPYYQLLNDKDKILFEKRVQKFINMKSFVPRGKLEKVLPEMKTLIAASAIQLTFGYPGIYFKHFWKIILYDNDYYSNITQNYHQGEVNTRGFIILSWNKFKDGYRHATNGRNLGLHEMAHALKIENAIKNEEYNFIDYDHLKEFYTLAYDEINLIRNNGSDFFRNYAGTNLHEFFAVTIENFFERPYEFSTYHPELYHATTKVLKQDPKLITPPSPSS